MEENNKKVEYNVYMLVYTDILGKRSKAFVAEESSQKALEALEESLINLGYSKKNIEKLLPLAKITNNKSDRTYIDFKR